MILVLIAVWLFLDYPQWGNLPHLSGLLAQRPPLFDLLGASALNGQIDDEVAYRLVNDGSRRRRTGC